MLVLLPFANEFTEAEDVWHFRVSSVIIYNFRSVIKFIQANPHIC
jgi:hypothetical protein